MNVFNPSMSGTEKSNQIVFSPTVTTPTKPKRNTTFTNTTTKKRRERVDKKKDIKASVTFQQKQKLMILAKLKSAQRGTRISVTQLATELVQKGLLQHEDFPECDYDPSLKAVHIKLEKFYADELFNHQIQWDVSMREAAARILTYMLKESEQGEV